MLGMARIQVAHFNIERITFNGALEEAAKVRKILESEVFSVSEIQSALRTLEGQKENLRVYCRGGSGTGREDVEKLWADISALIEQAKTFLPPVQPTKVLTTRKAPHPLSVDAGIELKTLKRNPNFCLLPDDALRNTFSFLSFGELAICLRINKSLKEIALLIVLWDRLVFLDKDRSIFLKLKSFSKEGVPPTLEDILHTRNIARSSTRFWFWHRERTKLAQVSVELRKLGFSHKTE